MDAFLASYTSDSRFHVEPYDLSTPTVLAKVSLESFRIDVNNILVEAFVTSPHLQSVYHGACLENVRTIRVGCAAVAKLATLMLWKRLQTVAELELGPGALELYPKRAPLTGNFELPSGVVAVINSFGTLDVADNIPPTRVVHIQNGQNLNNFGLAAVMTDAQFQEARSFLQVLQSIGVPFAKIDTK